MAGTRIEKYGSIYSRIKGLLRSGALKETERPLWVSVYEAFPPKQEPLYERPVPKQNDRKILYPEDFIRVKFYQTFGNTDVVNLSSTRVKTSCQVFIDKYFELQEQDVDTSKLFEETTRKLKEQGLPLRTVHDINQATENRKTRFKSLFAELSTAESPARESKTSIADVMKKVSSVKETTSEGSDRDKPS